MDLGGAGKGCGFRPSRILALGSGRTEWSVRCGGRHTGIAEVTPSARRGRPTDAVVPRRGLGKAFGTRDPLKLDVVGGVPRDGRIVVFEGSRMVSSGASSAKGLAFDGAKPSGSGSEASSVSTRPIWVQGWRRLVLGGTMGVKTRVKGSWRVSSPSYARSTTKEVGASGGGNRRRNSQPAGCRDAVPVRGRTSLFCEKLLPPDASCCSSPRTIRPQLHVPAWRWETMLDPLKLLFCQGHPPCVTSHAVP